METESLRRFTYYFSSSGYHLWLKDDKLIVVCQKHDKLNFILSKVNKLMMGLEEIDNGVAEAPLTSYPVFQCLSSSSPTHHSSSDRPYLKSSPLTCQYFESWRKQWLLQKNADLLRISFFFVFIGRQVKGLVERDSSNPAVPASRLPLFPPPPPLSPQPT